ncbi:MAG: hypothetical protein KAJ31_07585 [Deltaproteobacteria bacterium]|nr:hypothetical protein [Deltaproteobacteria bacterium]
MKIEISNHLIIVPIIMFFLLMFAFNTQVNAQANIPPGSYKKSCKDIQVVVGNV